MSNPKSLQERQTTYDNALADVEAKSAKWLEQRVESSRWRDLAAVDAELTLSVRALTRAERALTKALKRSHK